MSTEQPQGGTAGKSDTGRSCPYCRFPLKQGDALVRCGVCAAVLHDECWHDNGGCAVVACLGGPPAGESAAAAPRTATAHAGVTAEVPAATQEVPRQPPPGARYDDTNPRRQRTLVPWIVGAALLAAVVGAGAAVALALQKNGHTTTVIKAAAAAAPEVTTPSAAASTAVPSSDSQSGTTESSETAVAGDTGTGTSAAGDTSTTGPEANGLLPAESRSEMASGIQQTLLSFHEDITNGDWRDAWNLMSERKQQQSLRESGYDGWVNNQKSLGNYLDPSSLQVSIVSLDPGSGVATVNVTGMMWSPPGRAACGWDGITWVKYEHGQWRYDPGYSTTPQRRRQWGPPHDTSSAAYSTWKQDTWPKMMGGQCVSPD